MSSHVDAFLEKAGQDWSMRSWVTSSMSAYKNKTRTLGAATTVRAIRSETAKERVRRDIRGQERTIDCQLIVAATIDVTAIEDTTQEPPVFVSPSGVYYDAVAVGREAESIQGTHRIFLIKRRGVSTDLLSYVPADDESLIQDERSGTALEVESG